MKTESKKTPKMTLKQSAILEAATKEFCLAGFSGTSMDRIAELAEVSKRTVYNYYPSKDELFQAILDELITRIGEMKSCVYSSDEPLDGQLEGIGHIFAETITSKDFMRLSRVVISRFIRSPEWARSAYDQQARLRENLISWMKAGIKDGRLEVPDPGKAAAQFCGLIKEVVFWPELMWGQGAATVEERDRAVKEAVAIFLDHFQVK